MKESWSKTLMAVMIYLKPVTGDKLGLNKNSIFHTRRNINLIYLGVFQ
jgi:hypothetical protein